MLSECLIGQTDFCAGFCAFQIEQTPQFIHNRQHFHWHFSVSHQKSNLTQRKRCIRINNQCQKLYCLFKHFFTINHLKLLKK